MFACVPGAGGYDGIVVIGDNLSWLAEKWKVLKLKIRREGSVGYVNFG